MTSWSHTWDVYTSDVQRRYLAIVGIATAYGSASSPDRVKNFQLSISSKPAMGPNQPLTQLVEGVKRLECEADHYPATNAQVNIAGIYTPNPTHAFMM